MIKPPWPLDCINSPTSKRFGWTSVFHTLRFAKLTYFSVGLDFLLLVQTSLFGSTIPRCVPSPFCSFFAWSPFNFPLHEVAHELGEPTQETRLVAAIIAFSLCKSANSSGSFNSHPAYLAGKWVSMD